MQATITLRRVRPWLLAAMLAFVVSMVLPALASASFPWYDQAAMQNEPEARLRTSFIIDTSEGAVIPRQLFLTQPYLGLYESFGFDRNFFSWTPAASVGDAYMAGRAWTGCGGEPEAPQVSVPGNWSHCDPGAIKTGSANQMRHDVEHGTLTGFRWGDTFVSDICGNWSPANGAPKASPMPTISGVKYEDENADGIRDGNDPGLAGWTVKLFYNEEYVASTKTGPGGAYSFRLNADTMKTNTGVPIGEGKYTLREVSQAGWHQSQHPDPITIHYGAGEHNFSGNDFGNWQLATIAGHKFDDSNVSGTWDASEPGIENWRTFLSNGYEAFTGSGGSYSFSVKPGTYAVAETPRKGWRQTSPGGEGTRTYTVTSGQVVEGADFGNVCLGSVSVSAVDDSTGGPVSMETRLEERSVLGILENEPSLPRTAPETPTSFNELLPGAYRVVAFLPEGVFTTDPDAVPVEGRFAIVKDVSVRECETTSLVLHTITGSTPGALVTGGVKIALPEEFATGGFEFMTEANEPAEPRGTLQYNDHASGLNLHTSTIDLIHVDGEEAIVWGRVSFEGSQQVFRLRLVDAGEPGTSDRFELTVANGYMAGQGETLSGGNVRIHKA